MVGQMLKPQLQEERERLVRAAAASWGTSCSAGHAVDPTALYEFGSVALEQGRHTSAIRGINFFHASTRKGAKCAKLQPTRPCMLAFGLL